jgi:hypothetical protein
VYHFISEFPDDRACRLSLTLTKPRKLVCDLDVVKIAEGDGEGIALENGRPDCRLIGGRRVQLVTIPSACINSQFQYILHKTLPLDPFLSRIHAHRHFSFIRD